MVKRVFSFGSPTEAGSLNENNSTQKENFHHNLPYTSKKTEKISHREIFLERNNPIKNSQYLDINNEYLSIQKNFEKAISDYKNHNHNIKKDLIIIAIATAVAIIGVIAALTNPIGFAVGISVICIAKIFLIDRIIKIKSEKNSSEILYSSLLDSAVKANHLGSNKIRQEVEKIFSNEECNKFMKIFKTRIYKKASSIE